MVFCNNKDCSEWERLQKGHNPYFNRWFSAIHEQEHGQDITYRHNPYFNRWFSAMHQIQAPPPRVIIVTILILIDGFLQSVCTSKIVFFH